MTMIPVTERYPDDTRNVMTWSLKYGWVSACFEWGSNEDPCWWCKDHGAGFKYSVTHWCEMEDYTSHN